MTWMASAPRLRRDLIPKQKAKTMIRSDAMSTGGYPSTGHLCSSLIPRSRGIIWTRQMTYPTKWRNGRQVHRQEGRNNERSLPGLLAGLFQLLCYLLSNYRDSSPDRHGDVILRLLHRLEHSLSYMSEKARILGVMMMSLLSCVWLQELPGGRCTKTVAASSIHVFELRSGFRRLRLPRRSSKAEGN